MSEKSGVLADTLARQDDILSELLTVTLKQREALKDERLPDLQTLMSEMRHISVRAQAIETKRERAAADLAEELGCEPVVSAIASRLAPGEAIQVEDVARKLMSTVEKLKLEMSILSRLMDEAKNLNEMLISEWRKISARASGVPTGGFDTRI
jgi:hypothetical protein